MFHFYLIVMSIFRNKSRLNMRLICALYFKEVAKTNRKVVAGSSQ
jgi:hypothetical protein